MRVLIICTHPFFIVRGAPLRTRMFVEAYLALGHDVDVLAYPVGDDILEGKIRIFRPNASFYRKRSAGPSLGKIPMDFLMYRKAVELCRENRYDIIQCEDSEAVMIGLRLKKRCSACLIADFHNSLSENLRINGWLALYPLAKMVEGRLYRGPDLMIANSKPLEEMLRKKHSLDNVMTILDEVPSGEDVKPKVSLPLRYIAYSGSSKPYQGVELLLKAYKASGTKLHLVLIGDMGKDIAELSSSLGLGNKVISTGTLSIEETNYVLKRSVFNVIPRISGDQPGMKTIHYLSCKSPILATDLSCNTMYLAHLKNAFIVKPDMASLSQGIIRLSSDKALRESIKDNIKKSWKMQDTDKALSEALKRACR